jgi:ATP-binding cassette subfamily C protein
MATETDQVATEQRDSARGLIARALARLPKLLLFDEATSALDDRDQAIVPAHIERMNATCIVIAHRLSTIRHADRIYVLDRGRLAQSGAFDELMAVEGPFRRLAARQLL